MLKALFIAAALALASSASAQITVTVSSQGTEVIKATTGASPKTATLARLDVCSDGDADTNVSTARVSAAVTVAEGYSLYGSDVVDAVLLVLQQKDAFTRAQKAISAGSTTVVLLTALFKTFSPLAAGIISGAPAIAAAILPAVGDPRDLAALGKKILANNTVLALGKKGSGNDCHTGLVVAMASAVKIDKITVQ